MITRTTKRRQSDRRLDPEVQATMAEMRLHDYAENRAAIEALRLGSEIEIVAGLLLNKIEKIYIEGRLSWRSLCAVRKEYDRVVKQTGCPLPVEVTEKLDPSVGRWFGPSVVG